MIKFNVVTGSCATCIRRYFSYLLNHGAILRLRYVALKGVKRPVWLNGRAFARDLKGRRFESRPVRFQVTTLGKLLTPSHACASVTKQYNLVPADGR